MAVVQHCTPFVTTALLTQAQNTSKEALKLHNAFPKVFRQRKICVACEVGEILLMTEDETKRMIKWLFYGKIKCSSWFVELPVI